MVWITLPGYDGPSVLIILGHSQYPPGFPVPSALYRGVGPGMLFSTWGCYSQCLRTITISCQCCVTSPSWCRLHLLLSTCSIRWWHSCFQGLVTGSLHAWREVLNPSVFLVNSWTSILCPVPLCLDIDELSTELYLQLSAYHRGGWAVMES